MTRRVQRLSSFKKRWMRRLLYLVLALAWVVIMSFPVFAFLLATRGEIQLGDAGKNHLRLFLLSETDAQGVSLEYTHQSLQASGCYESNVYYFLWEGKGENVMYCQCFDPLTGQLLSGERGSCHNN